MKVDINDVPEFYRPYMSYVGEEELVSLLLSSGIELHETCQTLSEEKSLYRYEKGKWSIRDVVQHLIDSERIFSYRVMRFGRNDQTELSGFDQDQYVIDAKADQRTLEDLLREFGNVRATTVDLFKSLGEKELSRTGVSNQVKMSVATIGYIIAGHTLHHLRVIKDRYLK